MREIEDIHTHHREPEWGAVVSIRFAWPDTDPPFDTLRADGVYSIGVHPWDADVEADSGFWSQFEAMAEDARIVAIGECGIDLKTDIPLYRQLQIFRRQIEISEKLGKPVIIHDVKADDIICGLRRDLRPRHPWAIHGFRGKPAAAASLMRAGCHISFGMRFNPETVRMVPDDRLLAETDESQLSISEIIAEIAKVRNTKPEDLTAIIRANSKKFCNFED